MEEYKRIVVLGSTNMDTVAYVDHFSGPGETLMSRGFLMNYGCKGANQTVVVVRLGGRGLFVGKVVENVFGMSMLENLEKEGIGITRMMIEEEGYSGTVQIMIDTKGENMITVSPRANMKIMKKDIDHVIGEIDKSSFMLMQLEIPLETVLYIADMAYKKGKKVILNLVPAISIPEYLYKQLYVITPNETEAGILTGIEVRDGAGAKAVAEKLYIKGVENMIITMGSREAYVYNHTHCELEETTKINPIDTTAVGDTFNGALAVALAEGKDLIAAIHFANLVASVFVTRKGNQASTPYKKEIKSS